MKSRSSYLAVSEDSTIASTATATVTSSSSVPLVPSSTTKNGLSSGQIAGIVLGCLGKRNIRLPYGGSFENVSKCCLPHSRIHLPCCYCRLSHFTEKEEGPKSELAAENPVRTFGGTTSPQEQTHQRGARGREVVPSPRSSTTNIVRSPSAHSNYHNSGAEGVGGGGRRTFYRTQPVPRSAAARSARTSPRQPPQLLRSGSHRHNHHKNQPQYQHQQQQRRLL